MLEDSYSSKDTFYMKMRSITVEPRYNEPLYNKFLGKQTILLNSKIYGSMKKNLDISSNLVVTNIFCQFLGPSLYRGSTVFNFVWLVFKK